MMTWMLSGRKTGSPSGEQASLNLVRAFSNRESGIQLRQEILEALSHADKVIIDFADHDVSPSFADEAIGLLAAEVGLRAFKRKVQLKNVPEASRVLVRHVIQHRIARGASTAEATIHKVH